MGRSPLTETQRFWQKVDKSGECWMWTAGRDEKGYGTFRGGDQKMTKAHQWSYRERVGELPPGTEIDHLCRTRACVRPSHLEAVTHLENVRRALAKNACDEGHPFEVYGGVWCCRICTRRRLNAYQNERRRSAGAVPGGPGSAQRAMTHCKRGHEFTPENTTTNSQGHRWCRECTRIRSAAKRERQRQERP